MFFVNQVSLDEYGIVWLQVYYKNNILKLVKMKDL